jgi:OOP family OmpA-OmpF porin
MNKFLGGLVATCAVSLFASRSASAQQSGFAVNHFEASERGSEWFVMESLDLRGHVRPSIGVVGDWAYRPLVVTDSSGNVRRSIVRNQIFVNAGAGIVLWERLRASVNVPIMVFAEGRAATLGGVTYPGPASSAGIGDVRLGLDVRLFGKYGDVITGAVGAQLALPTGDAASYSGDGMVRAAPRALIAGDVGAFVYAAKLGVTIRAKDQSFAGGQVGSDVLFGAAVGLRLLEKKLVIGPELFGHTVVTGNGFFSRKGTPLEGLLGAHYTLGTDWRVGAGISTGFTPGFGAPVDRGLLSIEWVPGIAPPKAAEPPPPVVVPPAPEPDRDRDGIFDKDDACPDVPGVKTDDPKTNGCPPDRDHDGILDGDDACPDVPGVKTTDPKTNGCPEDLDRDKDGIPNAQDACPDEPGKPDPDPKKNGCPAAFVQNGQIKILDQVKFKTGSAQIQPGKESQDVLDAVLGVIKGHPEITKLRVEGHTDNRGAPALNKKLSGARAASVVTWLVAHGIDKARLTSEGFGPDRPLDTNDTDEGRKNNRRVEFHLVDAPPKGMEF